MILKAIKKITVCVLMMSSGYVMAQQEPQFTQYMYNPTSVNPAYAGARDALSVFGHYRTQWVGVEGAPQTLNFSAHTPLYNSRVGLGISFQNDVLGAMDENTLAIDFSYTIDVSRDFRLAFGLKGSANLLNVDYGKLTIADPTEVGENIESKFTPNIGAGLFLYSDKTYVGVSVPMFLSTTRYDDNIRSTMSQKAHIYA